MIDLKENEIKTKELRSAFENLFEEHEINVLWDLRTLSPCCGDFPLNLIKSLKPSGKLNRLQAINWETEYQMEIRQAGFSFIPDTMDRVAIIKEMEDPTSFTTLISEDQELIDFWLTLPEEERILISNPLSVTTEEDYQIRPYFYICDCEKSQKQRTAWACKYSFFSRMINKYPNISGIQWIARRAYRIRSRWIDLLVKLRIREDELAFLN